MSWKISEKRLLFDEIWELLRPWAKEKLYITSKSENNKITITTPESLECDCLNEHEDYCGLLIDDEYSSCTCDGNDYAKCVHIWELDESKTYADQLESALLFIQKFNMSKIRN